MFTFNNRCFLLLVALLSWCGCIMCPQSLDQGEVATLKSILTKLKAEGLFDLNPECLLSTSALLRTGPSNSKDIEENLVKCDCSFNDACHITEFVLKGYSLPGILPPELANLTSLVSIDLTRNYLEGQIPKEWASLRNLARLSLTANRLSGNIPKYLGRFTSLTYLSLEANQFTGNIPPELGNLVNLTVLILMSNQLEGYLPKELTQLKNLQDFRVSDNNLSGTVPGFIQSWTQLGRLRLHGSGMEGPVPPEIFYLKNLTDLRLNDISGPEFSFPNVSNMSNKLEALVLRNMNLSGKIPEDIWKLKNLSVLDVSFNKLEGEIPFDAELPNFTYIVSSYQILHSQHAERECS